jgi:tetratricopeptide (TPR) repeat protein
MSSGLATGRSNIWRYQTDVREALTAYQQAVATGRGQVLFIACPPDAGAAGVLHGLAELLNQATPPPAVVGGSFADGSYEPWPTRRRVPLDRLAAVIGAGVFSTAIDLAAPVVAAAAGAPFLASATSMAWQLAETSMGVRTVFEEHAQQSRPLPLGPDRLRALLRQAALERPVVCLLETADQAEGRQVWWSQFLLSFAAEVVRDPRVLLVVSLTGPAELGGHERDEPQPLYVARRVVEKGLARWCPLQPLTTADIGAWLHPCSAVLVARLHAATGGDPRWLAELWDDWHARRVVRRALDGTWQLTEPDSAGLGKVHDLLDTRLRRLLGTEEPAPLDDARELLATAALEGPRFTAEALADTLDRDPDEVIDFLDDTLAVNEGHPDGLVVDIGFVDVQHQGQETESRHLNRYEFVSTLHWWALRRYGLGGSSQVADRNERYAWALARVYAPQQARVASVVAHLLAAAGNRRAASDFARQADFDTTLDAQRRQALAVLQAPKDDWDQWDYIQATALLLRAGEAMEHACPLRETLTVYEGAADLAERMDLRHEWARALLCCGELHAQLGEATRAERLLEAARKLGQELGERATIAAACSRLGDVNRNRGEVAVARRYYEEALDGYRRLRYRGDEARIWGDLGAVDLDDGDLVGAREKLSKALHGLRELPGRDQQTTAMWYGLARVSYLEGDRVAATENAREALNLDREIGNRLGESYTQHLLGLVALDRGELGRPKTTSAARSRLCSSSATCTGKPKHLWCLAMWP